MQQNQNYMSHAAQGGTVLLPLPKEMEGNDFYRCTVNEVSVDTSDRSGDIFKVGSCKDGNNWVPTYGLSKPILMKLAVAAGVQFDPTNSGGEYLNRNCYKAKAFGGILQADGSPKTHYDEKIINLDDEEDNFRLEFLNKSLEGITDKKQAEEAEKLFAGEWRMTVNKWGKSCNAFFVAHQDRDAYIERGVLINMITLRKTMAEKAMSGAQLRVIRALLGVKSGYTKEELQRPFMIPRVSFSPDSTDPTVKMAMINRGLNATSSMFGAYTAKISQPKEGKREVKPVEIVDHQDTVVKNTCTLCQVEMKEEDYRESLARFGISICPKCYQEKGGTL